MPPYRIYFRDTAGAIVGREDFHARSDGAAVLIAEQLCDACADMCDAFEVWQGIRRIAAPYALVYGPSLSASEIDYTIQESILRREESIQRSQWTIARSQRLLERIRTLEADLLKMG